MKNKLLAILFGIIGVIFVVACLYVGVTYLGFIGKALIEFFSAGNIQSMNECGITTPQEFVDIRNQLPTTLLPAIYIGIPVSLILISALMFLSGYFFGKHKVMGDLDSHIKREEEIESEVQKRTGSKKEKHEKKETKGKK
jgi:hypothetical protein